MQQSNGIGGGYGVGLTAGEVLFTELFLWESGPSRIGLASR